MSEKGTAQEKEGLIQQPGGTQQGVKHVLIVNKLERASLRHHSSS